MPDLRCENKLHGVALPNGQIEVACNSRYCGKGPGVTVLHRFDPESGALLETKRFKTPGKGTQ
ncbi:hypothetical protein PBI_LAMBO_23 [Gordonia phage Lambo]|uniref:Uncharacterized protein n=14 Tax=Lambovirus TaxID=2843412 RepID=A0A9E7U4U6_9CAUD|nr:hypothetical protein HWC68_gp24 [Gordonia phage Gibbin]YP_009852475.1 hypothetical protein HWC69_gp023 [Gordonia phage Ranch]YP_009852576.1 hypothetical protein HWC70_gp23 [Gordonia phage Lambo]YP_009852674.1 hypothetical protein HWC71_gp23 [Gordonia phage Sadboi]YP_009853978.1 hypothetical protein HWC82_gp24 [Gordonia phage Yikes]QFG08235.1 hypothetical protein PBI_GRETELLYN_23 [Gordonia phage GretelLyn]UJQ86351.1 hypothetical protein WOJTEK_22 [Gordonia phage Wojtek]UVF61617.1 hypotheti